MSFLLATKMHIRLFYSLLTRPSLFESLNSYVYALLPTDKISNTFSLNMRWISICQLVPVPLCVFKSPQDISSIFQTKAPRREINLNIVGTFQTN